MTYVLIILFYSYSTSGPSMTSQQIEFKSKDKCEFAAKAIYKKIKVYDTFCVQTDK